MQIKSQKSNYNLLSLVVHFVGMCKPVTVNITEETKGAT